MKILVKTLNDKTIPLDIPEYRTVIQLKEQIQKKENIPVDHQRLIYLGKEMDDEIGNELSERKSMSNYNIEDGSTLYLVLKLRC